MNVLCYMNKCFNITLKIFLRNVSDLVIGFRSSMNNILTNNDTNIIQRNKIKLAYSNSWK